MEINETNYITQLSEAMKIEDYDKVLDIIDYTSSQAIMDWKFVFKYAYETGDIKLLNLAYGYSVDAETVNYYGERFIDVGLWYACAHGFTTLINFFIDHGADLNYGLFGACYGDYDEITELMINKGATDIKHAISLACNHKNTKHMDILMKKAHSKIDINKLSHLVYHHNCRQSRELAVYTYCKWRCNCSQSHINALLYFFNQGLTNTEYIKYYSVGILLNNGIKPQLFLNETVDNLIMTRNHKQNTVFTILDNVIINDILTYILLPFIQYMEYDEEMKIKFLKTQKY